MKKIFILVTVLVLLTFRSSAQLYVEQPQSSAYSYNGNSPGKFIIELANALKSGSFNNSYKNEKMRFLVKTDSVSNIIELESQIRALYSYIKPAKFKTGFNASVFDEKVVGKSSYTQAKTMLRSLENSLKQDAFTSIWKLERTNWSKGLEEFKF